MGLSTALNSALSGLRATQAGLELVANNVANVDTQGYTRKTLQLNAAINGDKAAGVRVGDVQRELDTYLRRQVQVETSGWSYTQVAASTLDRLQRMFGVPGSANAFDTMVNNFANALDSLVTTPDSQSARANVLSTAQLMSQSLNRASTEIQALRADADRSLADAAVRVNAILQDIGRIQNQITGAAGSTLPAAEIYDERDRLLEELSGFMDIQVLSHSNDQITIYTGSGIALFDGTPANVVFDRQVNVRAETQYSSDPAERSIGTILIQTMGNNFDLLGPGGVQSGSIRAYAEMRDEALVQAQTQLDELAAAMAQALGTNIVSDTDPAGGFGINLSGLQRGNMVTLSFTEGGQNYTVTLVNVADPANPNVTNDLTPDPNDIVIGVNFDFTNPAGTAAAINAALAAHPDLPGDVPAITLDGTALAPVIGAAASGAETVTGIRAGITTTVLADNGLAIPLFVDAGRGNQAYTGSLEGVPQSVGFAGRIALNPALLADPAKLVVYQTTQNSVGYPAEATAVMAFDINDYAPGDTFTFRIGSGTPVTLTMGSVTPTPATVTGTVQGLDPLATLDTLGLADGEAITVTTDTGPVTFTITDATTETLGDLINGLNGGGADITVTLDADGALQIVSNNTDDSIAVSGDMNAVFGLAGGAAAPGTASSGDFQDQAGFLAALNTALGTDGSAFFDGADMLSIELTSRTRALVLSGEIADGLGMTGTHDPRTPTLQGDTTRPKFLRDAFEFSSRLFGADTGVGGRMSPYEGSISGFARQIVEMQGRNAEMASRVAEGQEIVLTSLKDRFSQKSGVNLDQEMSSLVSLQTAYAANARVMSVIQEMFDLLMLR